MKISTFAGAVLVLAFSATCAAAQTFEPVTGYGSLGYGWLQGKNVDLDAVTGRLGGRFGDYFGVEGEVSIGVNHDQFIYSPPCPHGIICPLPVFFATARINNAEGIYAVGYFPVTPNLDLFARAGYGHSDYSPTRSFFQGFSEQSVNFGAGAQWFFDGVDGVRADYTRHNAFDQDRAARLAVGDSNVWSLSFVRRF